MSEMPGDIWALADGTWDEVDWGLSFFTHYVLASRLEEALGEVERLKADVTELMGINTELCGIIHDEPSVSQSQTRETTADEVTRVLDACDTSEEFERKHNFEPGATLEITTDFLRRIIRDAAHLSPPENESDGSSKP